MTTRLLATKLIATAVLLTACAATPEPPPPPAPVPEPCLAIKPGIVDAALGFRQLGLEMTNCGTKPYEVNGYPVVKLFDADHNLLDITVGHSATADPGPKPLTIKPGESLEAHFSWRNTVTDIDRVPLTATTLEVAPLEGLPAQKADPKTKLDMGNTSQANVTAWMPRRMSS
ncbi:DUF4232 domain-containing protein [Allokutzneria oryzae]|uniref:DUF4232 domain-containing protein n=1 Tax=Allokutzneria oryzae TaxID=1378989 RepID=A0ABV5ZT03_9PSEU